MADLSVNLAGLELPCFWMNASGLLGTPPAFARFATYETGAVVAKTISLDELHGNESPDFTQLAPGLYANSIGLSGAGVKARRDEMMDFYPLQKPLIDSVKPQETPEETAELISMLGGLYSAVELNISCPNVEGGLKVGQDPGLTEEFTRACRKAVPRGRPLIVKLTPNVQDIGAIALAAVRGGADIISAINTLDHVKGDYSRARQALARPPGGLSGPRILHKGLESVEKIREAVKVPIIGIGGIKTPQDAVEYLRRGADAVGIGTCLFLDRPMELNSQCNPNRTVKEFLKEFRVVMIREFERLGVKSSSKLKGARHE